MKKGHIENGYLNYCCKEEKMIVLYSIKSLKKVEAESGYTFDVLYPSNNTEIELQSMELSHLYFTEIKIPTSDKSVEKFLDIYFDAKLDESSIGSDKLRFVIRWNQAKYLANERKEKIIKINENN